MKFSVLLTFLCTSLAILDRSYYDALCIIIISIQSSRSAPARIKYEKPLENYLKNIILIVTLARGNGSKRSMWVPHR